jgi:quercetin dioxygenase-like cupin family protein
MRRRSLLAGALLPLLQAHASDLKVDTLTQQSIGDLKNAQVLLQVVSLPPGLKSGAHRHPGPVFGYVLEGVLELRIQGSEPRTLHKGEMFYEPDGAVHLESRNPSSRELSRFVAMVIGPVGKPAVLPEKA